MDYIAVIADAVVNFIKNFDVNSVVKAFTSVDWNGVKDTVIAAIEKIIAAIG